MRKHAHTRHAWSTFFGRLLVQKVHPVLNMYPAVHQYQYHTQFGIIAQILMMLQRRLFPWRNKDQRHNDPYGIQKMFMQLCVITHSQLATDSDGSQAYGL